MTDRPRDALQTLQELPRAAVVAQWLSTSLATESAGVGLFSSVLNPILLGDETLLILLLKICLAVQLEGKEAELAEIEKKTKTLQLP